MRQVLFHFSNSMSSITIFSYKKIWGVQQIALRNFWKKKYAKLFRTRKVDN